jgi:hypothetical protein
MDNRSATKSHYVVDSLVERVWVVLEDAEGRTFEVPRGWFVGDIREGDVLRISAIPAGEGPEGRTMLVLELDQEERERRAAEIAELRARLPRGPSGDLIL